MGELATIGHKVTGWGADGLPGGQPKSTWYDKYGRVFVLPTDPYSLGHYQDRGLRLTPPESPEPLVEDNDYSEGSVNMTRQLKAQGPSEVQRLEGLLSEAIAALNARTAEPIRKRGPDKKPRKRQKSKRERA